MRYLIVSDTHGKHGGLREIIERVGHVDGMFHLGDVEGGLDTILDMIDYPFYGVRGNNDFRSILDAEKIVQIGEHRVFMTHGHRYGILFGVEALLQAGKERNCDIVLFGHTHVPFLQERDGIWAANPGSVTYPRQAPAVPTYMLLEIDTQGRIHFSKDHL